MKRKKVILDTNLWISFLISKEFGVIDRLIIQGDLILIFSHESAEEFLTVAKRTKFNKYFADSELMVLLSLFDNYGKLVKVTTEVDKCRDSKDNFLLSLAVDSKADYLVTGDSDLLILKKINKTKILSWSEFLEEIFK